MIASHWSVRVLVLFAVMSWASLARAESVDASGTTPPRNGMHCCPVGQYVTGVHAGDNKLLCDTRATSYTSAQEVVEASFSDAGMRACPPGKAVTGIHVGNNRLTCAPLAASVREVDTITSRHGMHACPPGTTVAGIHVGNNLLLCAGDMPGNEIVDTGTTRNGMHSCPIGRFAVGVHAGNNQLLCSSAFGTYTAASEIQSVGGDTTHALATQSHGMHACPEGHGITGIHIANNSFMCAPIQQPLIPRLVDRTTARAGMHACPMGRPMSGLHVDQNLLLCGTQHRLNILAFTALPSNVAAGGTVTLSWSAECTAPDCSVTLTGGNLGTQNVGITGTMPNSPSVTSVYTLTGQSGGGVVSATQRVTVP